LIASSAADERTRLGATPKVSWKERTDFRSNEKWPANVLNDKTPGAFNGGGWAATKTTVCLLPDGEWALLQSH
jgi:hypothetical protein